MATAGLGLAVSGGFAYVAGIRTDVTDTSSLDEHGGAQRLDGDQTQAVKKAIVGGKAKNVILLIRSRRWLT